MSYLFSLLFCFKVILNLVRTHSNFEVAKIRIIYQLAKLVNQ
ncbi:hypothetical protein HMPREF9074_09361 [Capnocytophaga sp. oral taxon 329 str. F0087]|nr:hypothetical protein HMPREF9074_09361 [Capnocytophaga sp. oral taxon 329 str. F0087]